MIATEMAIEDVNKDQNILAEYEMQYEYVDSMVRDGGVVFVAVVAAAVVVVVGGAVVVVGGGGDGVVLLLLILTNSSRLRCHANCRHIKLVWFCLVIL